jgi:hypothetical protein
MIRKLWVGVVALSMGLVYASVANGESTLPAGCSRTDQQRAQMFSDKIETALANGDLTRYTSMSRELETGLSKACQAALDRRYPARVICSSEEVATVTSFVTNVAAAAKALDFTLMLQILGDLEDELSEECWLAVNRHVHPAIMEACNDEELDEMATYVSPALPLTRRAFAGDIMALLQLQALRNDMYQSVSPACAVTVRQMTAGRADPQPTPSPSPPSWITDHGGGTYSVPSLGVACGPSGCTQ